MIEKKRRVPGPVRVIAGAAATIAVVAGCTAGPPPPRQLSQAQISSMVERVNARVEPMPLGTGDGLGQQTFSVYTHERAATAR